MNGIDVIITDMLDGWSLSCIVLANVQIIELGPLYILCKCDSRRFDHRPAGGLRVFSHPKEGQ